MLQNCIEYALDRVDTEPALNASGWKQYRQETGFSGVTQPEDLEMVEAFLDFLKRKYFIQINWAGCGKEGPPPPKYKIRQKNRRRLKEESEHVIDWFLKTYDPWLVPRHMPEPTSFTGVPMYDPDDDNYFIPEPGPPDENDGFAISHADDYS